MFPQEIENLIPEFNPAIISVQRWIQKIENLGKVFNWNCSDVLRCALMRLGIVSKLWLNTVEIEEWSEFKRKIIRAFPSKVDEVDVHCMLVNRVKHPEESYETYVFDIMAKARMVNLSEEAVMKYIIHGIQNIDLRLVLASTMFGSTEDMLGALCRYESQERMKEMVKVNSVDQFASRKSQMECFNCREQGHKARKCPGKKTEQSQANKNYNQSRTASEPMSTNQERANPLDSTRSREVRVSAIGATETQRNNARGSTGYEGRISIDQTYLNILVRFGNYLKERNVLFDTGSPICLIRRSLLPNKINLQTKNNTCFTGLNNSRLEILGTFDTEIVINHIIYTLQFKVVPARTMRPMCILGSDFVKHNNLLVEYDARSILFKCNPADGMSAPMTPFNNLSMNDDLHPDIYNIEVSTDTFLKIDVDDLDIGDNTITLEHINGIKFLFTNSYVRGLKPSKPDFTYTMSIELNDKRPFNFTPRRLSHSRKIEIETQIAKLLQDGIIKESNSPYASRIVLVKKKRQLLEDVC